MWVTSGAASGRADVRVEAVVGRGAPRSGPSRAGGQRAANSAEEAGRWREGCGLLRVLAGIEPGTHVQAPETRSERDAHHSASSEPQETGG